LLRSKVELSRHLLQHSYQTMKNHLENITLEEALFIPEGGYRSVLGTLKHAAGWSQVYRSYAFDQNPQHWTQIDWPHDLRDEIIISKRYLNDVIDWFDKLHLMWMEALSTIGENQLDDLRPVHWGEQYPLYDIIVLIAGHHIYHAGELNQVLSIYRGEAWEEGEEVEENNISTIGHRVVPPWKRNS
jgi:hypothetical protein